MIVYQAHYKYGPGVEGTEYYAGTYGFIYSKKEDCQKEIDHYLSYPGDESDPISADLLEIEVKDEF